MKTCHVLAAFAILAALLTDPPPLSAQKNPCRSPVPPIRGVRLKMNYEMTFTYDARDESAGRAILTQLLTSDLNERGVDDRNTFVIADGERPNFTVRLAVSIDSTDHFSAEGALSGWGYGHITQIIIGDVFTTPAGLINRVADQVYKFIHLGWHEARPECR
jgi:hypothetical protein